MAVKVFTIESEYDSACRLGYPTTTYMGSSFAYKYDNDIIIRWGNSSRFYNKDGSKTAEFKQVLNPAESIKVNCRKNESIKLLAQVVNVPTIYEKKVPKGVLAVIRPIEHTAGNGFSVQKGPLKIEHGTYGTRYLDVTKSGGEYRVWFCGKKTLCGQRVKMECNEEQKHPCRSNWGYSFCGSIAPSLHHQTLMAAKKIGLDVGAADVLYYKRKWYFLELNSAPSVDHRVVREFFQEALKELVKEKFPEKKEEAPTAVPVVEVKPSEPKNNNDDGIKKKSEVVEKDISAEPPVPVVASS